MWWSVEVWPCWLARAHPPPIPRPSTAAPSAPSRPAPTPSALVGVRPFFASVGGGGPPGWAFRRRGAAARTARDWGPGLVRWPAPCWRGSSQSGASSCTPTPTPTPPLALCAQQSPLPPHRSDAPPPVYIRWSAPSGRRGRRLHATTTSRSGIPSFLYRPPFPPPPPSQPHHHRHHPQAHLSPQVAVAGTGFSSARRPTRRAVAPPCRGHTVAQFFPPAHGTLGAPARQPQRMGSGRVGLGATRPPCLLARCSCFLVGRRLVGKNMHQGRERKWEKAMEGPRGYSPQPRLYARGALSLADRRRLLTFMSFSLPLLSPAMLLRHPHPVPPSFPHALCACPSALSRILSLLCTPPPPPSLPPRSPCSRRRGRATLP